MRRVKRAAFIVIVFAVVGTVVPWTLIAFVQERRVRENVEQAKRDLATLRQTLDDYYRRRGFYPENLHPLTYRDPYDGGGPLDEKAIKDPWGQTYNYDPKQLHPQSGKPLLWSDGPPGKNMRITNWG